jgi:hypothetical protein
VLRSKPKRAAHYRGHPYPAKKLPDCSPHWTDVWLPRLSHFAQFGLFLFTLGISYFTVLPLYQKAVLEETIAKKEVEFNILTNSLNESYARLRSYAMKEFYIEAMPACGGLFIGRGRTDADTPSKPRAEQVFELNVPTCLVGLGGKFEVFKDLKAEDRRTFEVALLQIGQEIAAKRTQLVAEYETAAHRVTDADIAALPRDSFRVRTQEFIEKKLRGGVIDMNARRRLAESIAKEKLGSQYEEFIRDQVASLRSIRWNIAPHQHQ